MSIVVSPMASEAASPMITSVTPTLDPCGKDEGEGPGEGSGGGPARELDPARRHQKPPPLHTGADWKVVLHLPEIETWLRTTTVRVRDLTHSVHQDAVNKHVDVHLVQLKRRILGVVSPAAPEVGTEPVAAGDCVTDGLFPHGA
ncbi:hypothetical protein SKAU_G00339700 [Synaphobranchus kaupii]|uniref:Uncharacterized protein n=1 Tax=Synaphobranchus kaupii TaxID=118154 RepID=A0A9Q1EMU6_SYNKA|nr:hypothetical protein SKAU_G00339700 [Synaphobranchus kaupii]